MPSLPPRLRRLRRKTRPYYPVLWILLATVLLSGAWVAAHALLAARDLRSVQADLTELDRIGSRPGSEVAVQRLLGDVRHRADQARARTSGLAWKVWTHAPVLGSSLTVAHGVSTASSDLARRAVPALAETAQSLPHLRRSNGTLDLRPLNARATELQSAAEDVQAAHSQIAALPRSRFGLVQNNREKLEAHLGRLVARAQGLAVAAAAGPELLGQRGTRRYLVAVQNNAESRASGGIVGAYGVLRLTNGKATLEHFGPDSELQGTTRNAIDLGPEWRSRYDALGAARDWREVTASPDFPTVGATMLALWAATHSGERLDGVLSVDPVALADILQATGPISRRDGQRLESDTFVQRTVSDAYRLFPDKDARAAVLTEDAQAVFTALSSGAGEASSVAERLGRAVIGQHLKVYSGHPSTQSLLTRTALAGALPTNESPLLSVVTQDANADKLSYYLRRRIDYVPTLAGQRVDFGDGRGPQSQELAQLTIELSNTAPVTGLPDYVAPAVDLSNGGTIPRGRMKIAVSVYLGKAGQLDGARLDGTKIGMTSQTEQGLAVFTATVEIDPGGSRTLLLNVRQPTIPGQIVQILEQPLLFADKFS